MAEVFKVFEQDRVLQQRTWSRSLNFQFFWVGEGEVEVLKVLSQDGVQQRMWSRSLIFLLWRSPRFSPRPGFFLIESFA